MGTESSPKPAGTGKTCIFVILAVIGLLILGTVISSIATGINTRIRGTATPKATSLPEVDAWYACTSFVDTKYGISILDAQRYDVTGIEKVTTSGYDIKVYYPKQNRFFECLVERRENGDWVGIHVAPWP